MTWIEKTSPEAASGELSQIYSRIGTARGGVAEIHQVQALNPRALAAHLELYKSVVFARSSLSRAQRERIGVAVSAANRCHYCVAHHSEPLRHFGDSEEQIAALARGEIPADLPKADRTLLRWAQEATLEPASAANEPAIERLRAAGFDDRAILDAILTIGYFAFANRLVLLTGAELESGFEKTCTP